MGKGYRRRRSNLSLHKYVHSNNSRLYKNNEELGTHASMNEEFINLKNYIIAKFMDPLVKKKYGQIKENFFNFEYIETKLNSFNVPILEVQVDFLKKIVMVMKGAVETRFIIDDANKRIYGDNANVFLIETSKIVLKAKYEIYSLVFGDPKLNNADFKSPILIIIQKYLDESPGCTVDQIRSKLKHQYGDLFI